MLRVFFLVILYKFLHFIYRLSLFLFILYVILQLTTSIMHKANIPVPFVRTPYNYDRDAVSVATGLTCLDPSLTQQQFKDECDINEIVRRFGLTGQLPEPGQLPEYGDFSAVVDYHTAMNAIRAAEARFLAVPAHIRDRFQQDPAKFVDFCLDDANLDEAVKLGLVPPPAPSSDPSSPPNAGNP